VRTGVGKYIQDTKLDAGKGVVGGRAAAAVPAGGSGAGASGAAVSGAAGAAAGAAAAKGSGEMQPPAAKKPKVQSFGNFDAW